MTAADSPNRMTSEDRETIRHLAGMAMQSLVSRQGIPDSTSGREEFSLWSYRMAEAMLKTERELFGA